MSDIDAAQVECPKPVATKLRSCLLNNPSIRTSTNKSVSSQTTTTDDQPSIEAPGFRQPARRSVFLEVGLGGDDAIVDLKLQQNPRPKLHVRFSSKVQIHDSDDKDWSLSHLTTTSPLRDHSHDPMPAYFPTLPRIFFLVVIICVLLPSWHRSSELRASSGPVGVYAGPVAARFFDHARSLTAKVRRDVTPVQVCARNGQQAAVVNGTLWMYGGRATTYYDQSSNTWNNNFLKLDLTKTWQIQAPSLTGLPRPSGPPAVSQGYLWNSYDDLFLYGGMFSDSPATSPVPLATWKYNIASASWTESDNPTTVTGPDSTAANLPVQRAAEGAGVSIPQLGMGYYFGGHEDGYTTPGWSQSIARVYLSSLLEYTYPGYTNIALSTQASSNGMYRNITNSSPGFPPRADGAIVYVPGFGKSGILINLAGGTNATMSQLNLIDVYDIATSSWSQQTTSGPTPPVRVDPCIVAQSAADGSSTQIYMFGGQNLIPYGEQVQYQDLWILTIPSFTWIQANMAGQSVPAGRSGHTCNVWNGQMVVVGGYLGPNISCDYPGIYVLNTSSVQWQNQYVALDSGDNLNRQKSQQNDPGALGGSFGYQVPLIVQSIIGGNAQGFATVTAAAAPAVSGPFATGKAITYSVSSIATSTATSSASSASSSPTSQSSPVPNQPNSTSSSNSTTNVGAIVAGVFAGILGVLAIYLGFCAYIYRRQLQVYKNHVAMAQRQQLSNEGKHASMPAGPFTTNTSGGQSHHSQTSDERDGNNRPASDERANANRANVLQTNNPYRKVPGGEGYATAASSTEDLMDGMEPTFLGVFLNPRRSLRVVNRD